MTVWVWLAFINFFINNILLINTFQIPPEKPLELRIKVCTHEMKPYLLDTMLVS